MWLVHVRVLILLYNFGSVYFDQNRLNKALEYYQASAAYDSILGDTSAIATHFLGIGNVYLQLAELFASTNPAKSRNYYALSREQFRQRSLLWGRKNAVFPVVCHALELQTGWSRSAGDYEKALGTFSMLAQFKDSVYAQIGHEIFDETELKFRNQLLLAKVVAMEQNQNLTSFLIMMGWRPYPYLKIYCNTHTLSVLRDRNRHSPLNGPPPVCAYTTHIQSIKSIHLEFDNIFQVVLH